MRREYRIKKMNLNPEFPSSHIFFLSRFINPRAIEDFLHSEGWQIALNESPEIILRRFLIQGFLEQADLFGTLEYKYRIIDLKPLLKIRGLPVSGKKEDLIRRLVNSDPEAMEESVKGLKVYICTETGQDIAEKYLALLEEMRSKAEEESLNAIIERDYRKASLIVANYEVQQVFPRGLGVDWANHNPDDQIYILNLIISGKPKILGNLDERTIYHLRIGAGMMFLWGKNQARKWLPKDLKTNLLIDNDAAARMILFFAYHQRNMAKYRGMKYKSIMILSSQDSCEACKIMASREYKLSEVPELPYEGCSHKMGCRCTTVVGDFFKNIPTR